MWRRRCGEGCAEGAAEATCPAGTARLGGGIRLRAAVPPAVALVLRLRARRCGRAKSTVSAAWLCSGQAKRDGASEKRTRAALLFARGGFTPDVVEHANGDGVRGASRKRGAKDAACVPQSGFSTLASEDAALFSAGATALMHVHGLLLGHLWGRPAAQLPRLAPAINEEIISQQASRVGATDLFAYEYSCFVKFTGI